MRGGYWEEGELIGLRKVKGRRLIMKCNINVID
jgi:hypothetical protein